MIAGTAASNEKRESVLRPTRLLALGGIVALPLLYWKPLHAYLQTKHELEQRQAQVAALAAERRRLEQQITAVGSGSTLVREARRLGLVKPGERLFIVRGIDVWRRTHK
jgi:cell division protein FtsB